MLEEEDRETMINIIDYANKKLKQERLHVVRTPDWKRLDKMQILCEAIMREQKNLW